MVFMTVFVDYFFNGWFGKGCRRLSQFHVYFIFQLLCYDCDVFWFLDENGSDFGMDDGDLLFVFFPLGKLLSPVWVFISLPLIDVHMESRRRGYLSFFPTSPWRHFFSQEFVDDYDRNSGFLFPSLVFDVIFLYRLCGMFGHFDFSGFPIN